MTTEKELEFWLKREWNIKGRRMTFDIPSNSIFYDVDWLPTDINYNMIANVQNNRLASM